MAIVNWQIPPGYKQFFLGEKGCSYVLECLSNGQYLSSKVKDRFENVGCSWANTVLPQSVENADAESFESGGKLSIDEHAVKRLQNEKRKSWIVSRAPDLDFLVVELISVFLASEPKGICVIEDQTACPDDEYVKKFDTRMWLFDDVVYHVLFPGDSANVAWKVVKQAKSWLFLAFLVKVPNQVYGIHNREAVPGTVLDSIAEHTQYVIAGAYDGEGNILVPICQQPVEPAAGRMESNT